MEKVSLHCNFANCVKVRFFDEHFMHVFSVFPTRMTNVREGRREGNRLHLLSHLKSHTVCIAYETYE